MKCEPGGVGDLGLDIAINEALDADEVDPSAKALMNKQVRMLDLQMKNLTREADELGVKFLRERLHAAFEIATAAVVAAALVTLAVMAFQASRSEGLVIEPLDAPADLAARGLTGAILANRLSDGLGEIDAVTSSVRAGGAIRTTRHQDVKVKIPKTGLSISDAQSLMRSWLGHETPVGGELVRDGSRIGLTIRVGDRPGFTLYGAESDLDLLLRQAAEQVLARTEPYRYGAYLAAQNRRGEALSVAQGLAASGAPTDRAWGYAMWGRVLASDGDFAGAAAKARLSLGLDPDIAATHDNLAAAERLLGHDQQALASSVEAARLLRRQLRQLDKASGPIRLDTALGRVLEARSDPGDAAKLYARAVRAGGVSRATQAAASLPRALAADHDIAGAQRALDDIQGQLPEDALTDAVTVPGWVALKAGDWAGAETLLHRADATAALFGDAGLAARLTQIAPLLAYAQAMSGQIELARATIAPTPADCYTCARVRAVVAWQAGDRAGAERLFQQAAALGPSLPAADLEWGRMRLAFGDADGAMDHTRRAAKRAPAWADPLVLWGDALIRKGDLHTAAAKFRGAAERSPRWGLPVLRQGQILLRNGNRTAGRRMLETARGLTLTPAERGELDIALRSR